MFAIQAPFMSDIRHDRRRLLQYTLVAAALGYAIKPASGEAEGLTTIADNDVTARGLDYHLDTATVDRDAYPEHEPTQRCESCTHFLTLGAQRGCKLMPGKAVNANGWCKVWSAR